jgi:hypothetical protein
MFYFFQNYPHSPPAINLLLVVIRRGNDIIAGSLRPKSTRQQEIIIQSIRVQQTKDINLNNFLFQLVSHTAGSFPAILLVPLQTP